MEQFEDLESQLQVSKEIKDQLTKQKSQQQTNNFSQFECNICFDVAHEPVITNCGHLYCWECIYQWLNQNHDFLSCPVCKNGIDQNKLIPLYTKQDVNDGEQNLRPHQQQNIPPRPKPQRIRPIQNNNNQNGNQSQTNNISNGIIFAGYGYFPSLFNLMYQIKNDIDDIGLEQQSPEIQFQPLFNKIRILLIVFISFIAFNLLFNK